MTAKISVRDVIKQLRAEGLLDDVGKARAVAFVESSTYAQPWYVRTMVGSGAWFASLLLIGFVTGFTMAYEGGYAIVGLAFILVATGVRRKNDGDFLVQASLAVSLAGQALLAWGIGNAFGSNNVDLLLVLAMVLSAVMFVVFPDRIHRTLMVLFAAAAMTALLYSWKLNAVVPVAGPMFAAAAVYLHGRQSRLMTRRCGRYVRPLINGLMLSAFGVLLLSTVYILPELGTIEPQIYPRPWVSTVLLGAVFLGVGAGIAASLADSVSRASRLTLALVMVAVIGASWFAPGLLLALTVIMLGAASSHKTYIGAGIAFFIVFLTTYFYGIEVTLKTKSMTLVITGGTVLFARWLILRIVKAGKQRGASLRDITHQPLNKNGSVVLAVTVIIILGAVNLDVRNKEAIIADGTVVLLRIAPRDPRSLLQGDYMALRYALAETVADKAHDAGINDGLIVVELAATGEADFVAMYDGQPLTDAQRLLRFRRRGESVRLASDAFFFEEGQMEAYQQARFGELRVSDSGEAVLLGLRNDKYERLGSAGLLSPPE